MKSSTIDYGIDLGTTNSEIVCFDGTEQIVFRNPEGKSFTPSAVWIGADRGVIVGAKAKQRAGSDPQNAKIEFKRRMGMVAPYKFEAAGLSLLPEELSAEILKSLVADVRRLRGEDVQCAVITVPAMFEGPASDATRRAAALAGIRHAELLQEPIAAAMAYGLRANPKDKTQRTWIVFDLGGGTFDTSLVRMQDGRLTILDHDGQNHLGGKDIDAAILQSYLLPEMRRESRFAHLEYGNPEFLREMAILKDAVEAAKIRLSGEKATTTTISVRGLNRPGDKTDLDAEITLDRANLQSLSRRVMENAIQICTNLLERNSLEPTHIEKILLVGGPTISPGVRKTIKDRLKIPLDTSIDAITAVARGAAMYASQQELPSSHRIHQQDDSAEYHADFSFKPVVNDNTAYFGATVRRADGTPPPSGCRLMVVRADKGFQTAELPIALDGTVDATLLMDECGAHTFDVFMGDPGGRSVRISPDSFVVKRVGLVIGPAPLPRSVGVALRNNKVRWYIRKNSSLPAIGEGVHITARSFRWEHKGDLLTIPIIEGDYPRADRNRAIGFIHIGADAIKRDLPAGTAVKVTIEIDESRSLQAHARIVALDVVQPAMVDHQSIGTDARTLNGELKIQVARIAALTDDIKKNTAYIAQAASNDSTEENRKALREAERRLKDISDREAVADIERVLKEVENAESDAGKQADEMLQELAAQLDKVEGLIAWPKLLRRTEKASTEAQQAVAGSVNRDPGAAVELDGLTSIVEQARVSQDSTGLESAVGEMESLTVRLHLKDPEYLRLLIKDFSNELGDGFIDRDAAATHIGEATQALEREDLHGTLEHLAALYHLQPKTSTEAARIFESDLL